MRVESVNRLGNVVRQPEHLRRAMRQNNQLIVVIQQGGLPLQSPKERPPTWLTLTFQLPEEVDTVVSAELPNRLPPISLIFM